MEPFSHSPPLFETRIRSLRKVHQGKVRDIYDVDANHLLIVTSDRLSAFDVVLPDPIPGKGEMLCQISNFWFEKTAHLASNHLTGKPVAGALPAGIDAALYEKRSVVARRLKPVPRPALAYGGGRLNFRDAGDAQ